MGIKADFKTNFFVDLFEKREIPAIYSKILYLNDDQCLYDGLNKHTDASEIGDLYTVALIPDYFKPVLKNHKAYVEKSGNQENLGYAIFVKNVQSIDDYLKTQFKSNHKVIKRNITRLESCFNIHYRLFHGDISNESYDFLMGSLHEMLVRRFAQRKNDNKKLKEWDIIVNNTFELIKNKEASLFVIYDNDKPIDISLNYHHHKIVFSAIASYDIDYHKFGVGHVEMIKLLEWCIKDRYEVLELGYGDLEYKRRWSNHIYNFKYQVIYNQNALLMPFIAKLHFHKLTLKEYLKAKKANPLYQNVKERLTFKKPKGSNEDSELNYEKISITEQDRFELITKVDPETEDYMHLRRILYEFLYSGIEHKDNTSVYKITDKPQSFLIKGKNNTQQITFTN